MATKLKIKFELLMSLRASACLAYSETIDSRVTLLSMLNEANEVRTVSYTMLTVTWCCSEC